VIDPTPPFTVEQVSQRWQVDPNTVYKLAEQGKLASFKPRSLVRIPAAAVAAYEGRDVLDPDPPLSAEQLAGRWQLSPETVKDMVRAKQIFGFRVGRRTLIPAWAVSEFEAAGPPAPVRETPKPTTRPTSTADSPRDRLMRLVARGRTG
jgi:excisionase family DNA binding protein